MVAKVTTFKNPNNFDRLDKYSCSYADVYSWTNTEPLSLLGTAHVLLGFTLILTQLLISCYQVSSHLNSPLLPQLQEDKLSCLLF